MKKLILIFITAVSIYGCSDKTKCYECTENLYHVVNNSDGSQSLNLVQAEKENVCDVEDIEIYELANTYWMHDHRTYKETKCK